MKRDTAAMRKAWLSAHPYRTPEWLDARIAEGFDLHHVDRDPQNNAPGNLVLIESGDHLALHNGSAIAISRGRLGGIPLAGRPRGANQAQEAPQHADPIIAAARECKSTGGTLEDNPHIPWGACYRQWRRAFLVALQAIDRLPVTRRR